MKKLLVLTFVLGTFLSTISVFASESRTNCTAGAGHNRGQVETNSGESVNNGGGDNVEATVEP